MIPKYEEIFNFVLKNNEPLEEVVQMHKITVHYYDKEETIYSTDISIVNNISAPFIETMVVNEKEYENYLIKLNDYECKN